MHTQHSKMSEEVVRKQVEAGGKAKAKAEQVEQAKATPGGVTESVVARAVRLADRQRAEESRKVAAERAGRWAAYVALLQRAGSPKKTDATELSALMVELEISAEQVEQDLKLIAKYGELRARHADREAAHARWVKASTHARELEARLYEELGAARREAGLAQHEHSTASQAHFDLHLLQRGRPQLFKGEIGEQYRSDAPVAELVSSAAGP